MRMLWRRLLLLGLGLLGLVLPTGCWSLDELPPPAPELDVSGTWVGKTSGFSVEGIPEGPLRFLLMAFDGVLEFPDGVPLKLVLAQDPSQLDDPGLVSGTVEVGAVVTQTIKVRGYVKGKALDLTGSKKFFDNTPTFKVFIYSNSITKTSMTGEWSVYEGSSKVKGGRFTANRQ